MTPIVLWGMAGLALCALAVSLHDALLRPALRRLAARNLRRRLGESVLVVLGCSLGTATIVAALLVGSSFHESVRDGARTDLGPIDEVVTVRDVSDLPRVLAALGSDGASWGVDGVIGAVTAPVALSSVPPGSASPVRAAPDVVVAEIDMDEARRFGGDAKATGLASVERTPREGELLLNRSTARELGVGRGDVVTLHAYGSALELHVRAVVPNLGVAGFAEAFVAPGTVEGLASGDRRGGGQRPEGKVLVSNAGGIFGGAARSDDVVTELRARLEDIGGTEVSAVKKRLLDEADAQGDSMGQVFVGVGSFSVLAGVLLLVNLVTMLAEERRRELGIARAVGLRRLQVSRLFALEGTVYSVLAALIGGGLGVIVGWLVIAAARRALGPVDFHLRLAIPPGDVGLGAGLGFTVSIAAVWFTSFRIASLPVVRALRDLPAVPRHGHHLHTALPGALAVAGGVIGTVWGLLTGVPLAALVGPPLALLGALPLLRPLLGRRAAVGPLAALALVWCGGVFAFFPSVGRGVPIGVFVVQGVLLVATAVTLATAADHLWVVLVERMSRAGRGLSARIGLAYPLAKLGRTAMLLATYALVVFTLSFIAIYGRIFAGQADTFTREASAGTDLRVVSNPGNPVTATRLLAQPGVVAAASLWRSAPEFTTESRSTPTPWAMTGFDGSLLRSGAPGLAHRAAEYDSDRSAFEAVAADPGLLIVSGDFLTSVPGQPGGVRVGVGDQVIAHDPVSGAQRQLRVVGVLAHDVVREGSFASVDLVRDLMGDGAVQDTFYVTVAHDESPAAVAAALDGAFVANGVQARTFRSLVDDAIAVQLGFFRLMEGYLLMGLIIGTAAVGMVMVRAVRERRRQIGMLRAMGFSAATVRRAFAVEAGFIASQGAVMGLGLGLILSWQMLTHSAALGGEPLPYAVPWLSLAVLGLLPLGASLAAVVLPAGQAAKVNPAVALYRAD